LYRTGPHPLGGTASADKNGKAAMIALNPATGHKAGCDDVGRRRVDDLDTAALRQLLARSMHSFRLSDCWPFVPLRA
jgi:hypothetical protein